MATNQALGSKKDQVDIIIPEENMMPKLAMITDSQEQVTQSHRVIMQEIMKFLKNMLMILIYIMQFKHHYRLYKRKQIKVTKLKIWVMNKKE